MAPCAVMTYQQASDSKDEQGATHNADGHHAHEHSHWRLLSALAEKQMVDEPRELSVIVEEDMP